MTERYFVESPIQGHRASLFGAEAHHLLHVMRVQVGQEVILVDGSGAEFTATLENVERNQADLIIHHRNQVDRELPFPLTLGVALPKGQRQRWLVEKLVELGVNTLVPLHTVRAVASTETKTLQRLQRTVIEATKQCSRTRLMEITSATDVHDFFVTTPTDARRWIAHPGGSQSSTLQAACESPSASYLAIGPEGGFTDQEVADATQAGWKMVHLGPRILRTETAAIALSSLLSCAGV